MFDTWWNALNLELQVFFGLGIIALAVLFVQLIFSLFGGMDHDYDLDPSDHSSGLSFFSIRGITAFFVGFGWTGVIVLRAGHSVGAAILAGSAVGFSLMVLIFLMMKSMLRLQSSGTLDYNNAIGQIGSVYVTIPPNQQSGGQVEVLLQGRLTMADALSRSSEPLRPGTKIKVIEKIGHSTLVVEPLS